MQGEAYVQPPRKWAEPSPTYEHPAPPIPCRAAAWHEIPRGCSTMAKFAKLHGWTALVTFARGWTLPGKGSPSRLVDTMALRAGRESDRMYAIWKSEAECREYEFDGGAYRGRHGTWQLSSITAVREVLSSAPENAEEATGQGSLFDPPFSTTTSVARGATKGSPCV